MAMVCYEMERTVEDNSSRVMPPKGAEVLPLCCGESANQTRTLLPFRIK